MTGTDGIFITEVEAGPGIRLAVKDLFDTAGIRTTYGSAVFGEHVPVETAAAVRLLEDAGYANVGKTNLHEFAYGITSQNPHYGTVPNPAAPGRSSGGSSGGSAAALVAGLADAALGTHSGGSIRIPAAWCGIVGFKPSYGLVSTDGLFPLAPSFDHAGPMARDVAGCIEMMRVLVPGFEVAEVDLGELTAGAAWLELADPLVRAAVERAVGLARARTIELPHPEGTMPGFMREIADVHRDIYAEHGELYGDNMSTKIERCLAVSDAEAVAAGSARSAYTEQMLSLTASFDLWLTPTIEMVAPPADVDELAIRERVVRNTFPINHLGWPALALPCGPAEDGLSASVQIVGPAGSDAVVLGAGLALEAALARG